MATFPSISPTYQARKTTTPKINIAQFNDGYQHEKCEESEAGLRLELKMVLLLIGNPLEVVLHINGYAFVGLKQFPM